MAAILYMTFPTACSWMPIVVLLFLCHWFVFPRVESTVSISHHILPWLRAGHKPLPEPVMPEFTNVHMYHSTSMGWMVPVNIQRPLAIALQAALQSWLNVFRLGTQVAISGRRVCTMPLEDIIYIYVYIYIYIYIYIDIYAALLYQQPNIAVFARVWINSLITACMPLQIDTNRMISGLIYNAYVDI